MITSGDRRDVVAALGPLEARDAHVEAVHDEAGHDQERGRVEPSGVPSHRRQHQQRHGKDNPDRQLELEERGLAAAGQGLVDDAPVGEVEEPHGPVDRRARRRARGRSTCSSGISRARPKARAESRDSTIIMPARRDRGEVEEHGQQGRVPERVQLGRA